MERKINYENLPRTAEGERVTRGVFDQRPENPDSASDQGCYYVDGGKIRVPSLGN